jgi:long-chain acyl-CoA synthetase
VAQALVLGDGRPFPMALVAPNWALLKSELELPAEMDQATGCTQTAVIEFVRREVVAHTADLATFEQVRRIALLPRELTIEDGELSPTLKVKRRVVERKFADLIESAYREPATAGARA